MAGVQISVDLLPFGKRAQLAQESAAKQRIDAQLSSSEQQVRLEVSRLTFTGRRRRFRSKPRGPRWINRPKACAS